MVNYYEKYLKYKNKYLKLVDNIYGGSSNAAKNVVRNIMNSAVTGATNNALQKKKANLLATNIVTNAINDYTSKYTNLFPSNDTGSVQVHKTQYGIEQYNNKKLKKYIENNTNTITKFITYNTLEQNMATLLNGRSITTYHRYDELDKMFNIKLKTTTIPLFKLVTEIFEIYRSPTNINLTNEHKDLCRQFYNSCRMITTYPPCDELYTSVLAILSTEYSHVVDMDVINKCPTFMDLIDTLSSIINTKEGTFNTYKLSNGQNIINTYNITCKLCNQVTFNNIISELLDANSKIQNKSIRLPLVLGRLLKSINDRSIVAVEEFSQCLFIPFSYNDTVMTLLDHINNQQSTKYCCIINPDYNDDINTYFFTNNITFCGGSALFIPCNYFTELLKPIYYVLLSNTRVSEHLIEYDNSSSTYDNNPITRTFSFIDINNNMSTTDILLHCNPQFKSLKMSVIHPPSILGKHGKPTNRTIILLHDTTTNKLIVTGHHESDSNDTYNNDIKKYFINQIIEYINNYDIQQFYIIGDFNFDMNKLSKHISNNKFQFNTSINLNIKPDKPFTSYESLDPNASKIEIKLIDYLITNNNARELIIPINNEISYDIISQTGTDHKMVSYYVLDYNGSVDYTNLLAQSKKISIEHDSTIMQWPPTIIEKYTFINK